ncbi:MAG: hypothetical protein NZ580_02240 [Bacteroidia bacterium]|nr:hypothetical protein [Bacteroidia bacterium]MDW8235790.1 choice-of-anchor V domain-containing protein [Bacteroidia bacterium]
MGKGITILWVAVVGLSVVAFRSTNSSQPPVGYAGAPGDNGSCRNCHAGGSPAPRAALFLGSDTFRTYIPGGSAITLTLRVEHNTLTRYGFQLTVLSSQAGQENTPNQTLSTGGNTNVVLQQTGSGNRKYIAHSGISTTGTWNFSWTPPASNLGTLTWYIAANAVNGNGGTSGDAPGTFTQQTAVSPSSSLSHAEKYSSLFSIRQGMLWIHEEVRELIFYALDGREVARYGASGMQEWGLPSGLYVVRWRTADQEGSTKVFAP